MSDPWNVESHPAQPAKPLHPVPVEGPPVGSTGFVSPVGSFERVLTDTRSWLARFICVVDPLDLDLLALWAAHSHLAFETYTTPRLVLDSSMPGSGKTTVLEHLSRLCFSPVQAASLSSPALLARMLHAGMRTILIDEVDRSLDPKKPGVEDLLAILNSGYKRGGTRPVLTPGKGGEWNVTEMTTFSPVAMAGNHPHLPEDTRSRSIRVLLMPDLYGAVESSDWEEIEDEARELGERLRAGADSVRDRVRTERPPLPDGCIGRLKERWAPMKRIAAVASEEWADVADELIRRDIEETTRDREDGLTNIPPAYVLLKDVHDVIGNVAFISSSDLIRLLVSHSPKMWSEFSSYGKELTSQRLGRMLVTSFKIRASRQGDSHRGYFRADFDKAWRLTGVALPIKPAEPTEPVEPTAPSAEAPHPIKPTGPTEPTEPTCFECGLKRREGHEAGCEAA